MTTIIQRLRISLEPALRQLFHLYWRFARGMTLGVRAVVLDSENRVFLVKHSYVSGWHLPGGGVETGETFREALQRELVEEGRLLQLSPKVLGLAALFARLAIGLSLLNIGMATVMASAAPRFGGGPSPLPGEIAQCSTTS